MSDPGDRRRPVTDLTRSIAVEIHWLPKAGDLEYSEFDKYDSGSAEKEAREVPGPHSEPWFNVLAMHEPGTMASLDQVLADRQLGFRVRGTVLDLGAGIVAKLDAYLTREPAARTIVHGDLRIDNILFAPGGEACWLVARSSAPAQVEHGRRLPFRREQEPLDGLPQDARHPFRRDDGFAAADAPDQHQGGADVLDFLVGNPHHPPLGGLLPFVVQHDDARPGHAQLAEELPACAHDGI